MPPTKPHRSFPLALAFTLALACHAAANAQAPQSTASSPEAASNAVLTAPNPHQQTSPVAAVPPSVEFGALYGAEELGRVFPDSKTAADMIPRESPQQIVAAYDADEHRPGFSLKKFVGQYFTQPTQSDSGYVSPPHQTVVEHIDALWSVLRRDPDVSMSPWSSLLPLPYPYVVPGGRFDEIYYWDSYFIMLGLEQSGQHALAIDELNNFAALIDRYGHIPNGNRTYYLSRSQPPFFAEMVQLVALKDGDQTYLKYLPEMQQEYAYWMDGSDSLKSGAAYRHSVRLLNGALLNRYWDNRAAPRDESYFEDVTTAQQNPKLDAGELWRNLRAGGETGWDFSSRWLADGHTLTSINVTSLIPVDLNCLLLNLELTLAKAYRLKGDSAQAANFEHRATARADAIRNVLWDPQIKAFSDFNFVEQASTHRLTAATFAPLYVGVASTTQAMTVADTALAGLLRTGGLATTQISSGQQWDEPNGWAPLQYIAVMGLRRYGENVLARTIATRWIHTNTSYYARTGKLVEKYDIGAQAANVSATGGEYPLQDGFGWTNGVLRALLALYPDAAKSGPAAESPGAQARLQAAPAASVMH